MGTFFHTKRFSTTIQRCQRPIPSLPATSVASIPMKAVLLLLLYLGSSAFGFQNPVKRSCRSIAMSTSDNTSEPSHHPFCDLPGDPSLILTTNVDLGAKKLDIMKGIEWNRMCRVSWNVSLRFSLLTTALSALAGMSKAISQHTGKPESYVAVSINDNAAVIFGGSDAPTALGCLYSIGAVGKESNGAITKSVSDLLEEFGVEDNRICKYPWWAVSLPWRIHFFLLRMQCLTRSVWATSRH